MRRSYLLLVLGIILLAVGTTLLVAHLQTRNETVSIDRNQIMDKSGNQEIYVDVILLSRNLTAGDKLFAEASAVAGGGNPDYTRHFSFSVSILRDGIAIAENETNGELSTAELTKLSVQTEATRQGNYSIEYSHECWEQADYIRHNDWPEVLKADIIFERPIDETVIAFSIVVVIIGICLSTISYVIHPLERAQGVRPFCQQHMTGLFLPAGLSLFVWRKLPPSVYECPV